MTNPTTPDTTTTEPPVPPPKLFGWLMEQQEQPENADVRGEILREASRILQEYLGKEGKPK